MAYRTRIKYIYAQKQEIWVRWEKGESLTSIGRLFDRPSSSIFNILAPTGGIRPPLRKNSKRVHPCLNEKKFQEVLLLIYPFAQSLNI